MADLLLFHWSPTERRKQIIRYGLRPYCRPAVVVDPDDPYCKELKAWRAPYVAFATSPSLAWGLSGVMRPDIPSWDLWQTSTDRVSGYERLGLHDGKRSVGAEVRVYERIFKRDVWYVATRTQ